MSAGILRRGWLVRNRRWGSPLNALALFAFVVWLALVGSHHEPWFDEAQAWLIARDNTPWSLVTQGMRYEGSPALWQLLLMAAQRLGLPYGGLWLISGALACGGAWIVLYRSPFAAWLRVGLIFTYFFAYQYAVVARSYALDLLLLPLLAWMFEGRSRRPLLYAAVLGLAANINAHSFMLAGILALELAWTLRLRLIAADRKAATALVLYGAMALAAILQALPPADINFLISKPGDNPLLRGVAILREAFIDRVDVWSLAPPSFAARLFGEALTALVLIPAAVLWVKAGRGVLALGLFGALIGFSILKYGNYWHAGIVFLTFVFCLWISWDRRETLSPRWRGRLRAALLALLLVQGWEAAAAGVRGIALIYSAAPATARALQNDRRRHPGRTLGVAGFKAFAVQPWFAGNIFANYLDGAARPSFYLWRQAQAPIPGLSEDAWRATAGAGYDRLLLSSFNVMGWNGPARYIADAHRAGYCPTALFQGAMVWKTYPLETDDMMIFDRCQTRWLKPRRSP